MRTLYLLRVIFVSFEALVLVGAWWVFVKFSSQLDSLAASISLNEEVLKYLMLLPAALAAWIFNEARVLLQEDKETICILTAWPDYWKLKAHAYACLIYAVLFVFMSLMPWLVKSGIGTGIGLLLFIVSLIGQFSLAVSIYAARIRLKEIIVCVKSI